MVFWLVRAKPKLDRLRELRERLDSREISVMRPFGVSLSRGLLDARMRDDGYAVWEEEDYCRPPLAQEREAVLDDYFFDLSVEDVGEEGRGWRQLEKLPSLWKANATSVKSAKVTHARDYHR